MDGYGFTKTDCAIIKEKLERRLNMRQQFLKARTDPSIHAKQDVGYVFDPAVQRYMSMKAKELEYYQLTAMNGLKTFGMLIVPMLTYGYMVYSVRSEREHKIRTGQLKYRDRTFKFC